MKRTINYTGRTKINRSDITVTVTADADRLTFNLEANLTSYSFPRTAELWVEAYRVNTWMQFFWGTMGNPMPPSDRSLDEFEDPKGIRFRLSVVQSSGSERWKVLGVANNIGYFTPGGEIGNRSELLVVFGEDLGNTIWKLDMEGEAPVLMVNNAAEPSWQELARSIPFRSLVYPEVLRQLLRTILERGVEIDLEDQDSWESDWVRFSRNLGGMWPPPDKSVEGTSEWIECIVDKFCRRHDMLELLNQCNSHP